jgi:hypothetical protein
LRLCGGSGIRAFRNLARWVGIQAPFRNLARWVGEGQTPCGGPAGWIRGGRAPCTSLARWSWEIEAHRVAWCSRVAAELGPKYPPGAREPHFMEYGTACGHHGGLLVTFLVQLPDKI